MKIGDVWYEKHTVTEISQRTNTVSEAQVEKVDAIPQKWIPVSERLPTEEEYIANNGLFIVSDGNRTYAEYFDVYCSMRFGEPTMSGFRVDRCVAAWMPLPKTYEPQESENKK